MNTNLAHKYEDIYQGLDQYSNPVLIQSFMINNNADIVKALDYFNSKKQNAEGESLEYYNEIIKRYENLMIRRLVLTEDLVTQGQGTGNTDFSKSEEEDYNDRTIKVENMGPKEKDDVKVIKHPASKETVNEKLGKKLSNKEAKIVKKEVEKFQKEKEEKSHFEALFPTEEAQIQEFNKYIPKIQKLIESKEEQKARTLIKFIFRSGNPKTAFLNNDMQINRILTWLKSDMFTWMSVLEVIKNSKYSIADIVREAEHQYTMNSLNVDQIKDLVKPFFFNNNLREEGMNVESDEAFEDVFKRTFSYIWDKEHKVENQPKSIDRQAIKEEIYNLYKEKGAEGVRKMAHTFHKKLEALGTTSNLKGRLAEITAFLKQRDPDLLGVYLESKNTKDKQTNQETTNSEESKVEIQKSEIEEGETSVVVDMEKYQTQISSYKTLKSISEYLITLINKRPDNLSELKSQEDVEAFVYKLAKERILTKGGIDDDTEKWTIQDVSQWIGSDILPYTVDFYKMLSVNTDDEFKEAWRFYIEMFPEGKEKDRMSQLKDVLNSSFPKTKYSSNMGKKLRKNNKFVINQIQEVTNQIYKESGETKKVK